jgi:F0F1-type ATP synthase assembly protein I
MDNTSNKISKNNRQKSLTFNFFYATSMGMALGFLVAIPLVIFLLAGLFIDRKLNTLPLFLIIFILLSFVVVGVEIKNFILPFLEKRSRKIKINQ